MVRARDGASAFYNGPTQGSGAPAEIMQGRDVLILGSGPGVAAYRSAVEAFVLRKNRWCWRSTRKARLVKT